MMISGYAPEQVVIGISISGLVLAAFAILSRLFTRRVIVHNLGWDDGLATAALFLSIAVTLNTIPLYRHGIGKHQSQLSLADQETMMKAVWASFIIYHAAMLCVQESILVQFLRIFPHGRYRKVCYGLMIATLFQGTWTFWISVFLCSPVSFFWTQVIDSSTGECLDQTLVWCLTASVDILLYLAIGVLPIPVLQSIEMPRRKKYTLMLVFCLPGLTCLFSTMRLASLYNLALSNDLSYNQPLVSIFTTASINCAIFSCCMPTLKACLGRVFPRFIIAQPKEMGDRFSSTFLSNKSRSDSLGGLLNVSPPESPKRLSDGDPTAQCDHAPCVPPDPLRSNPIGGEQTLRPETSPPAFHLQRPSLRSTLSSIPSSIDSMVSDNNSILEAHGTDCSNRRNLLRPKSAQDRFSNLTLVRPSAAHRRAFPPTISFPPFSPTLPKEKIPYHPEILTRPLEAHLSIFDTPNLIPPPSTPPPSTPLPDPEKNSHRKPPTPINYLDRDAITPSSIFPSRLTPPEPATYIPKSVPRKPLPRTYNSPSSASMVRTPSTIRLIRRERGTGRYSAKEWVKEMFRTEGEGPNAPAAGMGMEGFVIGGGGGRERRGAGV